MMGAERLQDEQNRAGTSETEAWIWPGKVQKTRGTWLVRQSDFRSPKTEQAMFPLKQNRLIAQKAAFRGLVPSGKQTLVLNPCYEKTHPPEIRKSISVPILALTASPEYARQLGPRKRRGDVLLPCSMAIT